VGAPALVLGVLFSLLAGAALQQPETVVDVRVHGNVATSDEEIKTIAGVPIGSPAAPETIQHATNRLRATNRFRQVQVLKRFASIEDPTQVVLVIIVDEGPVTLDRTGIPESPIRIARARGLHLLFLPILTAEDGYGVTYGVQFAKPDPAGPHSRLSLPATWGGDKRAAVELEKNLDGPVSRVVAGASISRRTHPFYRMDEDRDRLWVRAEREILPPLRAGATAGWQHVSFLDANSAFSHAGADLVLDTRLDPVLARNAVYARAAWDHIDVGGASGINRSALEGRGYLGLLGQTVLALRVLREDADRPLPAYLQSMLGGLANLRGFRAGTAVGDTLVAGSLELRVPLSSPLELGKVGVSAFIDSGTVYDKGQRLADQTFRRGVGGAVWLSAAVIKLNVAVAHGLGASTRVHVGGSLSF
jgi:outer membrane protein assembly factor BamA